MTSLFSHQSLLCKLEKGPVYYLYLTEGGFKVKQPEVTQPVTDSQDAHLHLGGGHSVLFSLYHALISQYILT